MRHEAAGAPRAAAIACALALAVTVAARGQDYTPPPAAGYVNVRTDGGARGDGATDDTAALKPIIEAGKNAPHPKFGAARHIYIPNGVYLISQPIVVGDKKKAIFGQSTAKTILKLKDNCPAFAGKPTPVIDTRGRRHFAQNFFQRIRNLTIDTGSGNPGAIGLEFHTNNGGGVYDVLIRTSDPGKRGAVGLSQTRGSGPGLIWNVAVHGFDVGSLITGGLHSMAFYGITLRNQRVCGFQNKGNVASIGRLVSRNRAPAVMNSGGGHMVIAGGELTGGNPAQTAILNDQAGFFCRDITTSGYGTAIRSGDAVVKGPAVDDFAWPEVATLFDTPKRSLHLPVEEPPMPPLPARAQWTVVEAEGKNDDLTVPLQRAIDAGHEHIFVSNTKFGRIRDTIHVRGRVKRITGAPTVFRTEGFTRDKLVSYKPLKIDRAQDPKPVWRIEDGQSDVVVLEFLHDSYGSAGWAVEHASKRTLILWAAGGSYRNTVTGGKAFFIDCGPFPGSILRGPQKVWAWHTNTESYAHSPHILNDGATLWVLGLKTEKDRTIVRTIRGGFTEILGGLLYKNRERIGQAPAFVCQDASVALSYKVTGQRYQVHVLEAQAGQTRELTHERTYGRKVALFVGRPPAERK